MSEFADTVPFPANPYPAKPVVDLRLAPGSAAIDQGVVLVGLNDGFAGAAPDLGAYELGATPPVYGPRTAGTGGSGGASGEAGTSGGGGGASDAGGSTGNGGQGGTGGIFAGTGSDSPDASPATGKAAGGCGCSQSGGGGGTASLALIVLMLAVRLARRARPGVGT
jgi:MYXO-CTERM domain-containing protein